MKLSICMMIKDEEKNLHRCLEKLKPLTDSGLAELIIVDTGSTDNSVNIAKQYTNKVYFHKWNKNFSDMRNISISYAKGEWIFIIDADERLDDGDKLEKLMNSSVIDSYNTIMMKIKNLDNENDETRYNLITSPRIFKNDGSFKYIGAVHNQPIFKGPNLSVDIFMTHYGYISVDKELMEKKFLRTTELLLNELEKDPGNLYYMYQLGISYDMHSNHKKSLEQFRKAYEVLKKQKLNEKKGYVYIYASHARIAYTNGEYRESIKIAKEAVNLKKDYVDLYYIMGISELQLKNNEAAAEYFKQYLKLAENYDKLDISKDMSTIMYHMDQLSISMAYFQLSSYYINHEEYEEAYKYFKNIDEVNKKIVLSINILIPLGKYEELRGIYLGIATEKEKNNFLVTLEEKIMTLNEEQKSMLFKEFGKNNDIYGGLNKLRNETEDKSNIAKNLIKEIDFNKTPIFYCEVFNYFKEDMDFIINTFQGIESWNLRAIVKLMAEKNGFKDVFHEYLIKEVNENRNIEANKVYTAIAYVVLLLNMKDNHEVDEKHNEIFKRYIEAGISFVSELYKIEKAELLYKNINNPEDRFFVILYIANKKVKENDKKAAIKYIIEALNIYEAYAKYIDLYKNEILKLGENIEMDEFSKYKLQVKDNIKSLITQGLFMEASELIKDYEEIVKGDIEIFSMKSVIAAMTGNNAEALKILKSGLKIDDINEDLLYNLCFIQGQSNKTEAVESFAKARLFNPESIVKIGDLVEDVPKIDYNNIRILNGTIEIAHQMGTITEGLRKNGANAKSVDYYPNYLGYKSDYTLDISKLKNTEEVNNETKNFAAKMISQNDIFHFHFGTSLTMDYSDLDLIKELNKKVFMQHWGSDVRLYSKAKELNRFIKVKNINEDGIKRRLEVLSKHISNCIVSDYELYEYVKGFYKNIHLVRQCIDLENYKPISSKNKKPLLVHAPSSPEIKGTQYILQAVESLKEKYDFDFTLVKGMPHEEAKKIYAKADLIIDQVLCGSYGIFSIEAMAMGKPVLCWISDFMKEKYPKELPIISANPENVKEKIEYMLCNREMLSEIGAQSRIYVEKYHDKDVIGKELLELYKNAK